MKYLRPAHFLFLTALALLFWSTPERLHRAPRPSWEYKVKLSLGVALCLGFGWYSLKSLRRDLRFARGETKKEQEYQVRLESRSALTLFPIEGEGPCQFRLKLERLARDSSCDEILIARIDSRRKETDMARLGFTFNKETYEGDVTEVGKWVIGFKIWAPDVLTQPFNGKVRIRILGNGLNIRIPEKFSGN